MKRSTTRKHVFMLLFRVEFHEEAELKEQDKLYFEGNEEISDKDRQYIQDRTYAIEAKLPEIDAKLKAISEGWNINRMGKVELTVLRLAVYEILFDDDIPTNVAINEAVEIAKLYGGDTAPSFVNGILGKLIK